MKIPSTLFAFALLTPAFAQTSGTLATQTAANWTTAPWTSLSGPDAYPTADGTATLNAVTNTIFGTVPGITTLTLDTAVTLSRLTYNAPFAYTIAGTSPNNLVLSATGATIDVTRSILNTSTLFVLTNNISATISGGGSTGLTKTGIGTVTLSGTNTYTGGTHINGGQLLISAAAAIGDATLGATGVGNGLSFDGGSLFVNITSGWTTSRDIALGAGGGTFLLNTAATLNGVISGSGAFTRSSFSGALTLTAANTYTGATNLNTTGATATLSGNGSIAASSAYDLSGTLALNNSGTNINDRLSDTAALTSRGATIALTGNASAPTAETVGATTLEGGLTTLTVTPNAAQPARLSVASITREGASVLFVRGTNLGATPAANVATITSAVAPTLVGGGGAAGSTTISIVPWALGNGNATATLGSSFVTYDATNGFRPLATGEYGADFTGDASNNVRISAATVAPVATVNALLFAPAAAVTLSGGPIAITSGAFLYSPTAAVTGTVSAALAFGSAQGMIHSTNTLTLGSPISGTGGVVFDSLSASAPITVTGSSTYTGTTTIIGGGIRYAGTIANDGTTAGPFGQSTSAIVLQPGSTDIRFWATAASIIDRDIIVQNSGNAVVDLGTSNSGYTVTVNGAIELQRQLSLNSSSTVSSAMILHGAITGPGSLTDASSSFIILDNANNTFSGGLNISTGTYAAGADNAFGTGLISFSGNGVAGKIQSADTTTRTLGNNILMASSSLPTFQGTGSLTFTGAVDLNGPRSIAVTTTDPAKITFSGLVSNGAITKTGSGWLNLARPAGNTYTGGTVLGANAGTLEVNNTTGSGTGPGTVSIGTGSTLAGSFTISGATSIAGTLSPGTNGIGAANFAGNLTLGSVATTTIEIAGASSFDTINVTGALTLDGAIVVTTTSGYQASWGSSYHVIGWSVVDASGFDVATDLNLTGAAVAPGLNWDTSRFLIDGTITAVPEPTAWGVMLGGTLLGGILLRHRRLLRK